MCCQTRLRKTKKEVEKCDEEVTREGIPLRMRRYRSKKREWEAVDCVLDALSRVSLAARALSFGRGRIVREHSLLPILKGSLQWDGATRFMTNTINVEFV